jgi:mono/diheme cytochrome c family protein
LKTRLIIAFILTIPLALFAAGKGKKAPASASKGSVAEGAKLFQEDCNMCHFADKVDPKIGPGLKGLFKNKELPASHRPATEANVREQILKGNPQGKPMPMPAFADKLKPEQLDSLIQYLKTL